jgi:hypothetical protein
MSCRTGSFPSLNQAPAPLCPNPNPSAPPLFPLLPLCFPPHQTPWPHLGSSNWTLPRTPPRRTEHGNSTAVDPRVFPTQPHEPRSVAKLAPVVPFIHCFSERRREPSSPPAAPVLPRPRQIPRANQGTSLSPFPLLSLSINICA